MLLRHPPPADFWGCKGTFSEKLFRTQLSYFKDIDHSESIEYIAPVVSDEEIMKFIIDKATDIDLQ